jgi:2-oxoisovalerate dehydrogenase E1 component
MHRNLGLFTSRNVPLDRLFAQFQGKEHGFTNGRDRSFHFGSKEHKIVGMISHLGPQLSIAGGIALAHKLDKEQKCSLVFTGDGGASEGDFHEALNVAAVWQLPVIFVIENNQWGLSTPSNEQFRCKQFIDKAIGYGIEAIQVDGNNIIEVYDTVKSIAEDIRKNPRPFMLECISFRMRGHEEASGTKYYPEGLIEKWASKDPVENFEKYLLMEGVLTESLVSLKKQNIKDEIQKSLEIAYDKALPVASTEKEIADLFQAFTLVENSINTETKELRFIDAVSEGLREAMRKHKNLVLMGQDIAEYGGVFKVTEGFINEFGKERVRNTPLCESAIIGAALGLSIKGKKAMVEMQFADFVSCGFNQIVNNLAKIHWRWGQNADVVIRMPTGAGVGAGPFHSQSNEAWFFHVPGLKIAYPAFPDDAKKLMLTAFEDPNPVLFFEHKALYRSVSGAVQTGYCTLEFGKANLLKEGNEVSIVTYGAGVHWALEVLDKNKEISADLIDLRTLAPLDYESIYTSVKKTNKLIVLHEDNLTGGIGAEIAARVTENCFSFLDAAVVRVASIDSPVPFSAPLEKNYLPQDRFEQKLKELIAY